MSKTGEFDVHLADGCNTWQVETHGKKNANYCSVVSYIVKRPTRLTPQWDA